MDGLTLIDANFHGTRPNGLADDAEEPMDLANHLLFASGEMRKNFVAQTNPR
jgi:hypothetical protein